MPNTMMGYGGVQPQRAVTPATPIRQDYAGPLPTGGGSLVPGGGNVRPPKDYAGPLPQGGGGLGRGFPLPPKLGNESPNFDQSFFQSDAYRNSLKQPPQQATQALPYIPPELGGGMNYIGGSPNFDESLGAYRNPPAPPTLGVTPIRGPFPTPPAPPTLGVTPIRGPFPFPTPRELNNGTISFPTQTPDQMQALRNAHLAQQQAQLLMAQQQPQQALPYIPPNAGITALPMNPAMMQRLGTIASLAGGVRR